MLNYRDVTYLNTGWAPNLGAGSWTISFVTSNITPSSTLFYIFGDINTASFRCFTNGVAGATNWILRGAGLTDVYINGGATEATHRCAFVYDATLNNVKAYLDGVLVSTVAQTAPNLTGTGPLKVMGYSSNVGAPVGGLLDDFRLYSRALSDTEVADIDVGPAVTLTGNGVSIADGDTTPTATDDTDFGSVLRGETSIHTFTIANTGSADLTLDTVTVGGPNAVDFTVSVAATSPVTAGNSTTFQVTFSPSAGGLRSATLSFTNNVSGKSPFDFNIQGTGIGPEVIIEQPAGTEQVDETGSITFGSVKPGVAEQTLAVTIRNTGDADLTGLALSVDGTNPGDFILGTLPVTSLVPNDSTTFNITFRPRGLGARNAMLHVTNNDSDEASYDLALSGTGETIASAINNIALGMGAAAPGAGTNGLPADAKVASFNIPAIDDDGNVAFVAKWASVTGPVKKGTGLFNDNACLAILGGVAPVTDAKWKSFTDPVVDDDTIVTIAGLAPTAKTKVPASVVASGSTSLGVIARVGDIAPTFDGTQPVGGAVFKAFKAVSIHDGAIGFFAQLTGGTGAEKTTTANDWGLWLKDNAGPLKLIVREGQQVSGKTIKTLVTFIPSKDSPGQGRGWVTRVGGVGVVMALAFMTDKSQAIVSADFAGTVVFYAASGVIGVNGSPNIAGTSFASFGLPATNDADTNTFRASLTVGAGGVVKADSRGIFTGGFSGSYTPLAREGKPSGFLDTNFATLGDPIVSANSSLAFLATLKPTATVKGLATKTLWWQPTGQSLKLLAQAGPAVPGGVPAATTVGDLPGAQWAKFTNLAIAGAGRGPIFAATLVPKKGVVTPAAASGVWACDFTGTPRLLFRKGDMIGGKTLKSFTLLKATVGNMGVTRSFNDAAHVVWLATFTDKSTAIITTEVP